MRTEICGHSSVHGLLLEGPGQRDLILVTNPGYMPFGDDAERVLALARRVLRLQFDDFTAQVLDLDIRLPSEADVEEALAFAPHSDDLVVACHAGVSRSSALAYVLRCRDWGPPSAVTILERGIHAPNRLIVEMGARVLRNLEVWDTYETWRGVPRR